jgi:hypothetical protein
MMRRLRWLAVVAPALLLSACNYAPLCPDAGGIPAETPKCYHYEKITALNPDTKEVKSTVTESVVKEDQSHWDNTIEMKDYQFHTHIYQVQDSDFPKLTVGQSYMFTIEPSQSVLKLCIEKVCDEAKEKFRPFAPK